MKVPLGYLKNLSNAQYNLHRSSNAGWHRWFIQRSSKFWKATGSDIPVLMVSPIFIKRTIQSSKFNKRRRVRYRWFIQRSSPNFETQRVLTFHHWLCHLCFFYVLGLVSSKTEFDIWFHRCYIYIYRLYSFVLALEQHLWSVPMIWFRNRTS